MSSMNRDGSRLDGGQKNAMRRPANELKHSRKASPPRGGVPKISTKRVSQANIEKPIGKFGNPTKRAMGGPMPMAPTYPGAANAVGTANSAQSMGMRGWNPQLGANQAFKNGGMTKAKRCKRAEGGEATGRKVRPAVMTLKAKPVFGNKMELAESTKAKPMLGRNGAGRRRMPEMESMPSRGRQAVRDMAMKPGRDFPMPKMNRPLRSMRPKSRG